MFNVFQVSSFSVRVLIMLFYLCYMSNYIYIFFPMQEMSDSREIRSKENADRGGARPQLTEIEEVRRKTIEANRRYMEKLGLRPLVFYSKY